jgi:hypothetical protein
MAQRPVLRLDPNGPTTRRGSVLKRWKALDTDRSSWRSHWIEISDNLLPRRGRYLLESAHTNPRIRSGKIYDSTGSFALRTMSAGMMTGLTSPARPWFRFRVHEELMEEDGVKTWLGEAAKVCRTLLSASNFYTSMATVYTELGAFGNGPVLRHRHPQRSIHYRPYTAGEYALAEDQFGDVSTLAREYQLTVSQCVENFVLGSITGEPDWSVVSPTVKSLWDRGSYDTLVPVVHMIRPRTQNELDPDRLDGANKPWADIYIEAGSDKALDVVLREGGYDRKPFYAPRWDVRPGDIYGVSPAMEALPDIKQLNHQQRRKGQAIDKMVSPPMIAHSTLRGKATTVLPSGVTYVDALTQDAGFRPAYQVDPRLNELREDIAEVQERVLRAFYADLFAMMINSDRRQITATEVAERHEEKLVLLGPVLQRLNTDMLDPMIEDVFYIALEEGLLPEVPEAMINADIEVKYISLLAQAQEAVAASGIERSLGLAGNMAAVWPEIVDNVDPDKAYREYTEIVGTGPEILREQAEVDEIRRQRAQQAAMEQQAAALEAGSTTAQKSAQAAKLLSETDTSQPSALNQLLRMGAA